MNKENCKLWKKNKLINPITNRKIKKNGPTYKKFYKFCKKSNSKNKCKQWKKHKTTNPITNRKIKKNSFTYLKFAKECLSDYKFQKKKSFIKIMQQIKNEIKGTRYENKFHHLFNNSLTKYYSGYRPEKIYRLTLVENKNLKIKLKQIRKNIHPDRFGYLIDKYPIFKKYVNRAFQRIHMLYEIINSNIDVQEFMEYDKFPETSIERLIKDDRDDKI